MINGRFRLKWVALELLCLFLKTTNMILTNTISKNSTKLKYTVSCTKTETYSTVPPVQLVQHNKTKLTTYTI